MTDFFIKLTSIEDKPFYFRASAIIGVKKNPDCTTILTTRSIEYVKESIEDVLKLLNGYMELVVKEVEKPLKGDGKDLEEAT